jgi:RNA polymerase sigma-70 factor, ECF subfamily
MSDCDQAAVLRMIHDAHGKALLRYVLGLTRGDMPFAEDVVQESLLRLWRNPDVLGQPSSAVRAWLFTVAKHQVIDDRRSARYVRELRTGEMPEQSSPDGINATCDQLVLSVALMSLRRDHRVAVIRAYYLGQTIADIAAHEHVPEGTVKSRLHYALQTLRNRLGETGEVA